jgi:ParB-like chromosome segregation protein Spo0J
MLFNLIISSSAFSYSDPSISEFINFLYSRHLCLEPRTAEAQERAARSARSRLQLALHAQRDPLRDEIREVSRGLSLADTQTGRYGRLYSRRRLGARRGADARALLLDPSLTSSLRLRQDKRLPERNPPYN